MKEGGETDIEVFVPETLSRVIHIHAAPPRGVGRREFTEFAPRSRDAIPMGHFGGLMFRMIEDETMPDGDRCQFLLGDTPGQYACAWHGTRGQPTACALAPVGVARTATETVFAIPRSRYSWCQGSRQMIDSGAQGFTLRELLLRNDGEDRLAEDSLFGEALEATRKWKRGFRNHHSPLALLYIAVIPELESVLAGY